MFPFVLMLSNILQLLGKELPLPVNDRLSAWVRLNLQLKLYANLNKRKREIFATVFCDYFLEIYLPDTLLLFLLFYFW